MTVSTNDMREEYTASAGQTIFNYTFKIFADTDLKVYQTSAGAVADDSTDLISAYTVTGVGNDAGGTVVLDSGATLNDLITIVGDIPRSRTTNYANNGDFLPDTVNDDNDRVVSLVKQVEDMANRAALLQQSQQGTKPLSLPVPTAGNYLVWNATEDGFDNTATAFGTGIQPEDGTEFVFNDAGYDVDLRFESNVNTCTFFMDGESGNIGFGTCNIESWISTYTALQIGDDQNIFGLTSASGLGNLYITTNAYIGTSNWAYQDVSNPATYYRQNNGGHFFYHALADVGTPFWYQLLSLSPTATAFNTSQQDVNFNIATSVDTNSFNIDGGTGVISFSNTNDLLSFDASETVFNDDQADIDFRIKSNINEYSFFIEGSSSNIGFNCGALEAWDSILTAVQLGGNSAISATTATDSGGATDIIKNAYYDGDWKNQAAGESCLYQIAAGFHYFGYTTNHATPDTIFSWSSVLQMNAFQAIFNEDGLDRDFRVESSTNILAFFIEGSSSNIGFNTDDFGSGAGVIGILNATTNPTVTPTGGGILFVDAGDDLLKFDSADGTTYNLCSSSSFTGTDSGNVVFNESGGNYDFRIESDFATHGFFLDGSTGHITFNSSVGTVTSINSTYFNTILHLGPSFVVGCPIATPEECYFVSGAYLDSGWKVGNSTGSMRTIFDNTSCSFAFFPASGLGSTITWRNVLNATVSEVCVNDDSNDVDFRVESDINAYALFIEGSSGNIGLNNGSLEAWVSGSTALQIGGNASIEGYTNPASSNVFWLYQNAYHDGSSSYKRISADEASAYRQTAGSHYFYHAITGAADSAISWINLLDLTISEAVFNIAGNDIDFRVESTTDGNAIFVNAGTGDISFSNSNVMLSLTSSEAVFNEGGADIDLRVESNVNANSFFLEGSSGNIGLNNGSLEAWPSTKTALQIGGLLTLYTDTTPAAGKSFSILNNSYYDSAWKYIVADEATRQDSFNGNHQFHYATAGAAPGDAISWNSVCYFGASGIVFNDAGNDLDFRVECDTITNAIFMDGATGIVSLPACYSHDMNGETYRDLLINDSGELGYDSSTIRKKTNVVDMEDIDWLYDLRPVNFEYKRRDDKGTYLNQGNGIKKYGMIAEEVEKINSGFIFYDEDGRTEGIQYREFIPVLIRALQDQRAEIECLKMRMAEA